MRDTCWMLVASVALTCFTIPASAGGYSTRYIEETGNNTASGHVAGYSDAGLGDFELSFLNGDHQVKRIGVWKSGTRVDGHLRDGNGGDPVRVKATYVKLPSAQIHAVDKTCTVSCTIPIKPRPKKGYALALVGFDFTYDGKDRSVRVIAVEPTADQQSYRVELLGKGNAKFRARVQYAWFRPQQSGTRKVSGSRGNNAKTPDMYTANIGSGAHVLQGFRAEFLNGDHHLRTLGIQRKGSRYATRFDDNNHDDPARVSLTLAWMK